MDKHTAFGAEFVEQAEAATFYGCDALPTVHDDRPWRLDPEL